MKTILVMTDFSQRAEHAAEFALHIAEKTHSNLLLFNAFFIPAIIPAETGVYPYYEEYSMVEKDNAKKLEEMAQRLSKKLHPAPAGNEIQIHISQRPFTTGGNIMESFDHRNIWLIIMGDKSREGLINNLVFGSMTTEVIDHAFCPVLLVPPQAKYRYIEKIAFASKLEKSDYKALRKLTDFAEFYNSDLVVVHVCSKKLTVEERAGHIDHFNKLTDKVDYFDITYEDIIGSDVPDTLTKFIRIANIDLLAMVHKKYSFIEGIFHRSTTKNMMNYHHIPLLIFPETN